MAPAALGFVLVAGPAEAQQQNLGHRVLGTDGINAGAQIEPGLYLAEGYASYAAYAVTDRNGNRVPTPLALSVVADRLGLVTALRLEPIATYVGFSVGVPAASVTGEFEVQDVRASVDDFGFGDIYLQPLRLGWRLAPLDLVGGFGVYVPTGHFEPGGIATVGDGQFVRELSLGAALSLDPARTWRVSALSSYVANLTKRDVDIRRGDTVQIQGGLGATLWRTIEVGVAGYALWQVTDDTGRDLPAILRGARDRAFGLGPEVDFVLPDLRSQLTLRYERDLAAASRPLGQIFLVGYAVSVGSP